MTQAVGSKITGAEVGGLLGFMAGKVLGQFDPFHDPRGRLLLVAPNVVHVERELEADPPDFRFWVCLHEETHRVQFTAVPWMRDHIFSEVQALAETVEPQRLLEDGVQAGDRGAAQPGQRLERRDARPVQHPRAEADHRPDDRRDVAAGGPRRRGDGRRRAGRDPDAWGRSG